MSLTTQRPASTDGPHGEPPLAVTSPEVSPTAGVAPVRPRREVLYFAVRDKRILLGAAVILFFLILSIVGPVLDPRDPMAEDGPTMAAPSAEYWFGTTFSGKDVFAQFVNGLQATFVVGLLGGGLAALVGMSIGFIAGYRGGMIDEILTMVTNIVLVVPTLVVLVVIAAFLSARGVVIEAAFIGFTSWPWAARAIRAQTFSLRAREFVDLANMSGLPTWKVIFREIAPNMGSYLFMTFILLFGGAVLIAATLDFIGLGPTEGISLGLMMNEAVLWAALQLGLWWWFIPPGLGITAIVGALYVMNVGLDEIFNPKLREL